MKAACSNEKDVSQIHLVTSCWHPSFYLRASSNVVCMYTLLTQHYNPNNGMLLHSETSFSLHYSEESDKQHRKKKIQHDRTSIMRRSSAQGSLANVIPKVILRLDRQNTSAVGTRVNLVSCAPSELHSFHKSIHALPSATLWYPTISSVPLGDASLSCLSSTST